MNPILIFWLLIIPIALALLGVVWWITYLMSFNIPVVILRFVGNKGRPLLLITKARKASRKGVTRLQVKGYKTPVRDFRAENYYPARKSRHGGLILWEFEDGWLTPVIPKKMDLSPQERERLEALASEVHQFHAAQFMFDPEKHARLRMETVEDIDADMFLQELERIENQYGTFWDILGKYGGHIILLMIAIILLVAVIQFFDKMPDLAAACSSAGVEVAKQGWIMNITGVPLG